MINPIFIIDFGGVLFQIEHKRALKKFMELSTDINRLNNANVEQFINSNEYIAFEKGAMSAAVFRGLLKDYFSINSDVQTLDDAWNSTFIKQFDDSIKIILELKKYGKCYLLSNTNEIHYEYFSHKCKQMLDLFDYCFYSHQIGMRKPDAEIFEYVLKKVNTPATSAFFLDDLQENIDAARLLGIEAVQITEQFSLGSFVKQYKNKFSTKQTIISKNS